LNRRGIQTIVVKSLPQVEELYGDISGRASADVDVVVRGTQARAALETLNELGFSVHEERELQALIRRYGPDRAAASRPWHLPGSEHASTLIDLHSDSMDPWHNPTLDPEIWKHANPVSLDGVDFLVLGAGDRLLLLCSHLFADMVHAPGIPDRKVADLQRALRAADDLDWRLVRERARATGTTTLLHLACDFVSEDGRGIEPIWRRHVPLVSPRRYALLRLFLNRRGRMLTGHERFVLFLLAYDRPALMFPLWKELLLPGRVTLGARASGSVPSWPRYLELLAHFYAVRLRRLRSIWIAWRRS
jgi:hypothetical protein